MQPKKSWRPVTSPNAEHLFQQAERLIAPTGPGPARQVDIRRAISSAYYGVFHAVLAAAADEFVGSTKRASIEYGLAYRSVDHRALRDLCADVAKPTLPGRYRPYEPEGGFKPDLKAFAATVVELLQSRQEADYDPLVRLKRSDAVLAVSTARSTLRRFNTSSAAGRTAFLALLLFPPR
jgi:hypothetical protein